MDRGLTLIYRVVSEYVRVGVDGIHVEDQVLMKRCGHLNGKSVVPREEYYCTFGYSIKLTEAFVKTSE